MPELCTDLGKWKSSAKLFENIFDDTVHPNSPIILEKTSSSSVSILASITSPDSIRKQSQKNAKIKLHWPKRFLCVELDKKSPVAALEWVAHIDSSPQNMKNNFCQYDFVWDWKKDSSQGNMQQWKIFCTNMKMWKSFRKIQKMANL